MASILKSITVLGECYSFETAGYITNKNETHMKYVNQNIIDTYSRLLGGRLVQQCLLKLGQSDETAARTNFSTA